MPEIPDTLRLLFTADLQQREEKHIIELPADQVGSPDSAITPGEQYRVAIIEFHRATEQTSESGERSTREPPENAQNPPVAEDEVRTVTIEALGDQGDGIAKVERGYVLIVPGGEPGDELTVRIDEVRETVGFAQMISGEK
ncbi:TRAM domain-containing protein [Natronorarus salvus]|uniref:TRAM domain-containing protein n=1 Tax=Natronorarus salvus TaxID=3117733 RepID=UPI002F261ED5